jgi:hypothetical protein
VIHVTSSGEQARQHRAMTRLSHSIAGLAATAATAAVAAVAAGAGLAEASPSTPRHIVYACQVSHLWLTPGHHPIGVLFPGARFEVKRYSSSRRWVEGTTGSPGARHRQRGWVRISGLCRNRPEQPATSPVRAAGGFVPSPNPS